MQAESVETMCHILEGEKEIKEAKACNCHARWLGHHQE